MNGIGPTINGEFFLDHIPDEEETDTTFWKTNEFHKVKGFFQIFLELSNRRQNLLMRLG